MPIKATLNKSVKSHKYIVVSVGTHFSVQQEKDEKREFPKQSPQQPGHVKIFYMAGRLFTLLVTGRSGSNHCAALGDREKTWNSTPNSAWKVTIGEGG